MDSEQIADLFTVFGAVDVRRMFGGFGVFADGLMIAIVQGGAIFLKADEATTASFASEGQGAFTYEARGRRISLSYWRMPDRLYDEPDELARWAADALAAARRSHTKTPRKRGGKSAEKLRE
jgi:DNA transformation protein